MSDSTKVKSGPSRVRAGFSWINTIVIFLAALATIIACVWGFMHPPQSNDNNFQILGKRVDAVVAIIQSRPTAAATLAPVDSAGPAITGSDASAFAAMDVLSTQDTGLQMAYGYAKLVPGQSTQISIVLRLTSPKAAWKLFVVGPGGLVGWSVSSASGVRCSPIWNQLNGIPLFNNGD
jgi:hypothetical protein